MSSTPHTSVSCSCNATPPPIAPTPGAAPDHPIFAAVEDDLRDAKWVGTHGHEEDLRAALGKTILRVEELSALLRVAYGTTTELEMNLEVAPSNLKLVQVNNDMETFPPHRMNRISPTLEDDEEAKRVREWRHKLQKAFLTPKAPPKPEDMPQLDALFTAVEQYDKMSIAYLSFSKIGKIMRHIGVLKAYNVPRNAEYNFLTRAQTLVDKWHEILNSKKYEGNNEGTSEPKPEVTNGDGTEVDTGAMEVDALAGETVTAEAAE